MRAIRQLLFQSLVGCGYIGLSCVAEPAKLAGQRLSASRILTLKAQLTPEQIREVTAALTVHREP